jgi:hypothetical protein
MSYDEERQRKSRVVVETPTARREEHYVQTRRVPQERGGFSTGVVAAVAITAVALTALVVFFLMNRGTDPTQTTVNVSSAATPLPTVPTPLVITQQTPMPQMTPPPPIIVQAPPSSQPAPIIVPPASSGATAPAPNAAPDDATVESRVNKTLSADTDLGTLGITVTVIDGKATLNGLVKSEAQKSHAEQLAKSVRGVHTVDNKIIVEAQ